MNVLWDFLLPAAIVNALTVLPLAFLAWGVNRLMKQPALTHAVWVLVLVKLVTPPLFQLPLAVDLPASLSAHPAFDSIIPADATSPSAAATHDLVALAHPERNPGSAERQAVSISVSDSAERLPGANAAAPAVSSTRFSRAAIIATFLGVWLTGSLIWWGTQGLRMLWFARQLRRIGHRSPDLEAQTGRLAETIGLKRVPQVVLVDAIISPMLWGCGRRARILVPKVLSEQLDADARETLLMHELAHYVRGDHWTRVLELLVLGLFWWHPAAWWARREIEASEEECCDAWVVTRFPESKRRYATALLDTIDFLCEARVGMPPVASGLGEAAVLRRRLTRIMREIPANQLSRSLRGVLALVAGVVLPLQPLVVASSSRSAVEFSPLQAESLAQRTVVLSPVVAAHGEQSSPQASAPARRSVVRPRNAQNRAARGEQTLATALSPDGRFLISATTGYRVTLLDLETQLQADLSPAKITAVTFRPDAWQFVTAGADGRIVLWDSLTGKPVREIQSLNEPLRTVAVSPDGEAVAVGGRNGLLGLYEIETGSVLLNAARQPAAVNCVRFSPDGKRLAVATGGWMASEQGEVSLWNLDSGAVDGPYPFTTSPGAVAFVSNDELIIGQWNGRASLWNLSTAAPVAWANADKDTVTAAAFSSDNPLLREVEFLPTGLGLELLQQLSPIFSVGNSR